MVDLEDRQLIINTSPHLAWHPNGILGKQLFSVMEHMKNVT
jgi:hypothetical protein